MYDAFIQAVTGLLHPIIILYMLGGSVLGLIFGIIPGLSGMTYLALLIPFTYGLSPLEAMTLLLAGHAVVHTSGGISSVLINVPGTASSAPVLLDGFPMAQQGQAGRAIANVVVASAVGGVFGAVILIISIPILRPIVMAFGSPELFCMCMVGIIFIGVLGVGSMIKGLITGAMGIALAFVGFDPVAAYSRFDFGSLYLTSGIRIIPLVLGLFAVPQVINLMVTGTSIAKKGDITTARSDLWQGVKDVFIHWSLTLRTSLIGAFIGALPGAGAEAAAWISYGHAKQTSKHPERFGHGSVEGIIGPEAADNSKEGGSLIPTLAFGIPGSAAMAILLGAFLIVGLDPGPLFLKQHLDICYAMIITLVITNIFGAIISLASAQYLVRITFIPSLVLSPLIMVVVVLGAFVSKGNWLDVISTFAIGGLGYAMVRFAYPRPPLILGFVLGGLAERYLHLSVKTMGPLFFLTPISIVIISLTVLAILYNQLRSLLKRRGNN